MVISTPLFYFLDSRLRGNDAKTAVIGFKTKLDSRLRGNDRAVEFLRGHQEKNE